MLELLSGFFPGSGVSATFRLPSAGLGVEMFLVQQDAVPFDPCGQRYCLGGSLRLFRTLVSTSLWLSLEGGVGYLAIVGR